jgi:deoxyribodipyrimidine photo-lyase
MQNEISIFWHRRDLRIDDNAGLYYALKERGNVVPLFIFDTRILSLLPSCDPRVSFLHNQVEKLKESYRTFGSDMLVYYGDPEEIFSSLLESFTFHAVYTNVDYEPYAKERDHKIATLLGSKGIRFATYKDHVFFDYTEVLKDDGKPYTVFTPYSKKWLAKCNDYYLQSYPTLNYTHRLNTATTFTPCIELKAMGFEKSETEIPPLEVNDTIILQYDKQRDYPAIRGTTQMGIHLRFGTLSIRKLVKTYKEKSPKWVGELIWRDFYAQILAHFPHVAEGAFKPAYNNIKWRNNEKEFELWKKGKTGVPIVDAGMRELMQTGFMHNRVRMIVASYLCKNLLIDWRWGEAWFAEKLLDFDLSSNNGGWQWAAGSGVDAAPYFRIFNPELQTKKFDPHYLYIKKWVPEYNSPTYKSMILVDHAFARKRCLEVYQNALKTQGV